MSNTIDTRWASARQELADAAARADIDSGVLARIAGFESQYNPQARPIASHKHAELNTVTQFDGVKAMSSAYGYGQFTDETWGGMVRQYGEKYGVANAGHLTNAQANAPGLRNDTGLQAGMLAEFTRANMARGAQLGGPDADANVYALHNLGGSAGTRFLETLRQHPGARVDSILSSTVIERNPGLYGDGSGTVADAYKVMGQQMSRYASYADDIRSVTPGYAVPAPAVTPVPARPVAMRDVLQDGMYGDDVRTLQGQLVKLGYTGANGAPLRADGHYGPATKAAVEAFQRDHHLQPDGVSGPLTHRQLDNQLRLQAQAIPVNHPAHPDHAVFRQALDGVHKLDAQHGHVPDQRSENLAAALAAAARNQGMSRVDQVLLSDDVTRAFAVQEDLMAPFRRFASVDVVRAVATPVQQSSEALAHDAKRAAQDMSRQSPVAVQTQQQSSGAMQL